MAADVSLPEVVPTTIMLISTPQPESIPINQSRKHSTRLIHTYFDRKLAQLSWKCVQLIPAQVHVYQTLQIHYTIRDVPDGVVITMKSF